MRQLCDWSDPLSFPAWEIMFLMHPAESHLCPQPTSWHHNAMKHPSQAAISRTAGWRGWCDDSDNAPAPAPLLHLPVTTNITWMWTRETRQQWCDFFFLLQLRHKQVSLSFNLIIGRWIRKAPAHVRSGKVWRQRNLLWLSDYLYLKRSKPLIRDRNRTRRSTQI